ncbi:MAG: hypothetical protein ACLQVY_13570 [Limisphaerales bacterium]
MTLRRRNANKKDGGKPRPDGGTMWDMKRVEATDILAWHALSTLPDSVAGRRKVLCAVLTLCPASRYADRISVMLVHLEQQASIGSKIQLQSAPRLPETNEE